MYVYLTVLAPFMIEAKQVIWPIPWNSSDGDGKECKIENLVEVAERRMKLWNPYIGDVTTFGSLILFPVGVHSLHLAWLDTSARPLRYHCHSHNKPFCKGLDHINHQVTLGEVAGKLYRFDNQAQRFHIDPTSSSFQVFDPLRNKWQILPNPPFVRFVYKYFCVQFLDAGKKILGWDCEERNLFCFDTTRPELGWSYLYYETDEAGHHYVPFIDSHRKILFVHNNHPDCGDFYLIFRYHPETLHVSASFLSGDLEDYGTLRTHIHLREWCYESELREYISFYKAYLHDEFELVDLGGQKVAIVLHRYENKDGGVKPGSILVVAFEYEIICVKPFIRIKTRWIKKRCFQYHYKHLPPVEPSLDVRLNGSFLL